MHSVRNVKQIVNSIPNYLIIFNNKKDDSSATVVFCLMLVDVINTKLMPKPQQMSKLKIKSNFNALKGFGNNYLPLTFAFRRTTNVDERR